jgi:ABC-type transport system substrate-binding protein
MNTLRPAGRTIAGLVSFALLLAACTSAAAPSTAPSASPTEPSPDTPVSASPSDGTGGGSSADPGIGVGAKPILPKPGQAIDIHPIAAEQLAARVDGNKIIVKAVWTSGVEPCTILDSIVVDQSGGTYTITLQEGSSPQEIACIAIAEQHVTEFEIPNVPPGSYTITDSGGLAQPIQVTVS